MLDVRCLEFSNGVLAASALFHFSSLELVENVSGKNPFPHFLFVPAGVTPPRLTSSSFCAALKRVEVEECVRWMVPFAMALREVGSSPMKTFPGISADDMHNIQTHAPYVTWLVGPTAVCVCVRLFISPHSHRFVTLLISLSLRGTIGCF